MKLPILMPEKLRYTEVAENDDILYDMLVKIPPDLVTFFESATDDETWCNKHSNFTSSIMTWLTRQFFQDRLLVDYVTRCQKAIHQHYGALEPMIPRDLTCVVKGRDYQVNSLLLGACSPELRLVIRRECRDKHTHRLVLEDFSNSVFEDLLEYSETGEVKELWRKPQEEIIDELRQIQSWRIEPLIEMCQGILKRYVDPKTAVDMLLLAHKEDWSILRGEAIDCLNQMGRGVKIHDRGTDKFVFEFLDFKPPAMKLFEQFKHVITHLDFTNDVPENPEFSRVIPLCPKLRGIDISQTEYSSEFENLPRDLQELDISRCPWLDQVKLRQILRICPQLRVLHLVSNTQLAYNAWSCLTHLKGLESLDISRCSQITNEEFEIIVRSCPGLKRFEMDNCPRVSDLGFREVANVMSDLEELDLSRSAISDAALVDIATRCRKLRVLNLTRCETLTDVGVLQATEVATNLKCIVLTQCHLSAKALQDLRTSHPFLECRNT